MVSGNRKVPDFYIIYFIIFFANLKYFNNEPTTEIFVKLPDISQYDMQNVN